MITRAYARCNGGHYFQGACCPLDGWSSPASVELEAACRRLDQMGRRISLAALVEAGVSSGSLDRIIVIEFGSDAAAFEAVSPQGYVIDGKWSPLEEVEDAFL